MAPIDPSLLDSLDIICKSMDFLIVATPLAQRPYLGHTRYTDLKPFTACKAMWRKAETLFRDNGTWTIPINLESGAPFIPRTPPLWIDHFLVYITLSVYIPDLDFTPRRLCALRDQLIAVKVASPQLDTIILTIRTQEVPDLAVFGVLARNDTLFDQAQYLITSCLQPTVIHRGLRVSFEPDDEPLNHRFMPADATSFDKATSLVTNRDCVFFLPRPAGGWVDSAGAGLRW